MQVIERSRPVLPMLPPPAEAVQKLVDGLEYRGGCLRWRGKHDQRGYGLIWLDGKWQKVHRVRWETAYGPIGTDPDTGEALTIDHTCRVNDCAELSHLEAVTRAENTRRRWRVRGVGRAAAD